MTVTPNPIALAFSVFLATAALAADLYSVADLGMSGRTAVGGQINAAGHIVFGLLSEPAVGPSNFYFYDGTATADITGIFDSGAVLNDNDTLLGTRLGSAQGGVDVFRYTPPGAVGPPNGVVAQLSERGVVTDENDEGDFVGWHGPISTPLAFLSTASGQISDLGTLGGQNSLAQDINDFGQVVGMSTTGATREELEAGAASEEAFLYQNGQMIGLGTLGGQTSVARAINEQGQVVGDSSLPNRQSHAFLYDASGGMQDIGPPGINSVAYDINNFGVVTGQQYDPLGVLPSKAFLYDDVNGVQFLNDLLGSQTDWTSFLSATGINNRGQVVGTGVIGGEVHIFLLTPVPEPSSLTVLLLGSASAILLARRTNR